MGSPRPPDTQLHGRQLRLARTVWLALALPTIGLYLAGVPVYFAYLVTSCPAAACTNDQLSPDTLRTLHTLGLSVGFYAAYTVALTGAFLGLLLIPLSIGAAILRARLWDIDLLINRTLVYGALTACVIGLYVLIVGALSTLFQASSNLLIPLGATGLVAVLFQSLRDRMQRGVNQLMYGEAPAPAVDRRLGRGERQERRPDRNQPAADAGEQHVCQPDRKPYGAAGR